MSEVPLQVRTRYQVQQEEVSTLQKLEGWHQKLIIYQKLTVSYQNMAVKTQKLMV